MNASTNARERRCQWEYLIDKKQQCGSQWVMGLILMRFKVTKRNKEAIEDRRVVSLISGISYLKWEWGILDSRDTPLLGLTIGRENLLYKRD